MGKCKDCLHFKVCAYAGHYLPVCDRFVADVAPVRHGRWKRTADGAALCTACKRKMNPSQYGYAFCGLCGAKMDGD